MGFRDPPWKRNADRRPERDKNIQLVTDACNVPLNDIDQAPGGGVSPGREITATGIFLYRYYPGIGMLNVDQVNMGAFLVLGILVHVVW